MLDRFGKEFNHAKKQVPNMIGYGEVADEQRQIIEAAQDPDFGVPGMTLKQKIAAATAIFKKVKEEKKMTGARKIARDYIAPLIKEAHKVIDIACGDKWVGQEFHPPVYVGVDKIHGFDLTKADFGTIEPPDLILSVYGICTLLGEEARVWTLLRRLAKPTTKFVYVGRYFANPRRETGRQDPINGYNFESLEGLALASGWKIVDFKTWEYDGDSYRTPMTQAECNAFAATLEPIL